MLPVPPGLPKRRSYDYVRHGTTMLFAALEVATGKVTGARGRASRCTLGLQRLIPPRPPVGQSAPPSRFGQRYSSASCPIYRVTIRWLRQLQ
jgi:hypothetical protein